MPSLDQGVFLGQALRSVLEQPVDALELVVVDGGSVDDSLAQLAAFSAQHPGRLRWSSAPDGGPAQAINRAAQLSRAPVLGWLNADDLYEPGAIQRALDHLARVPEDVLVYGQATHVDQAGLAIGPYPTRAPETALAEFAHGCFICQPTVFVRRAAWQAAGGLDEGLRTAFDFDLWLRLFKAHPGRIGFVDALQARSRLHAGGITLRMRERVALEGMAVVHRHIGHAPVEWLLTHFDELCARHPFEPEPVDLPERMQGLIAQAEPWLAPQTVQMLRERVANDRPLQLASPQCFVSVYPDGWSGPVLQVRLRQPDSPCRAIVLQCRHAAPGDGALHLDIVSPDRPVQRLTLDQPGPFELTLPVDDPRPQARVVFQIVSRDCFVPAQCEAGSSDGRELGFLVEGSRLL